MNLLKLLKGLSVMGLLGVACLNVACANAQSAGGDLSDVDPTITPECDKTGFRLNGIRLRCPNPQEDEEGIITNRSIVYGYDVRTAGPVVPGGGPDQCTCNYQVSDSQGNIDYQKTVVLRLCNPDLQDEESELPSCDGLIPALAEPPTDFQTGQGSDPYSCTTSRGTRDCSATVSACSVFPSFCD
jgi:hypothetical protein